VLIAPRAWHERTAATLRDGVVNAVAMARDGAGEVHEELSDVA
jgi:hypothetical protein